MKIISFIEDEPVESLQIEREVIKKILKHLGLWPVESLQVEREKKARPPPKTRVAPTRTDTFIDDLFSQLPTSDKWLYVDPEYLSEA